MERDNYNSLINEYIRRMNSNFENNPCPRCGCQVYDPFTGKKLIHNVKKCGPESYRNESGKEESK